MEERTHMAAWHEGAKSGYEQELARAYIPSQHYECLYPPLEGLKKGTVFPALYRPYEGKHKREPMKYKPI